VDGADDGTEERPQALLLRRNRVVADTKAEGEMPDLRIAGTMPHPFRDLTPEEEAATIRAINESGADYLWVGIGTERQLVWMNRQTAQLGVDLDLLTLDSFDANSLPWTRTSELKER